MPQYREIVWGKGRLDQFKSWIDHELTNCLGDRGSLESKWRGQVIQWKARVIGDGTADVPFVGASDIEMPLAAIHADPVYADFLQNLHAPKDFWSVSPLRPTGVEQSKKLQEFLSLVEQRDIKMRRVNKRALLDMVVHGTCIYKDHILHERKKVQDYNLAGELEDVTKIKYQPLVEHIPLRDFFIPAYAWNIDPDDVGGAPWVAHRFYRTLGQFKKDAQGGPPYLPAYNKKAATAVESWQTNLQGENIVESIIQQEDEYVPWRKDKIKCYEIWARFDTSGDGIEDDIVVTWHQEARAVLRAIHTPLVHGKRVFEAGTYLPGFGFYGMGVAEVDEWAQLAISRLLNETINNASLANTVMLGVPLGANIMPDEAIYPGKIWPLGPQERISEVRMGQPYAGMFQIINDLAQWSEQRTGVSELRQGSIDSLPSRTPASTVMQLMGESGKRFDMIMANLRDGALGNIGQRVLQHVIQISKDDPRYIAFAMQAMGQEDGAIVAEILQGPVADIEANFGVSVTATSSKVNKEIDKQNLIGLAQFLGQMYPQQMQYAQGLMQMGMAGPELLGGTMMAAFTGTSEIARRLIEAYDIQNPSEYIPPPPAPPQQQGMMPGMQQPGMAPQPGMGAPPMAPAGAPPVLPNEAAIAALLGL